MKRKFFLLLFVFIIIVDNTSALELNSNLIEINTNKSYKFEITNNIKNDKNEEKDKYEKDKKNLKKEKNILKKEIRNRRVYHKNLLNMYNMDFDNNYLELITHNWLIISNLEKYYKLNFS